MVNEHDDALPDTLHEKTTLIITRMPLNRTQKQAAIRSLYFSNLGGGLAIGRSESLGHLDVGALADIVLLDQDPKRTAPEELTYVTVGSMWIGGRKIR